MAVAADYHAAFAEGGMRLMTFSDSRGTRIGRLEGDRAVDLAAAAPELPRTLLALLEAGPLALGRTASAKVVILS